MNNPTTSQLRALEMFQQMVNLPEDHESNRASAVARCLVREGIDVSRGWFDQLELTESSVVDVEVLEIEGALVDVKGIHSDWSDAALAYGGDPNRWRQEKPVEYSPFDPDWLGRRGRVALEQSISALSARLLQIDMEANTPEAAPDRPTRRM